MHSLYKWLLTIVIVMLLFRLLVMPHMGNYLVADHDLAEADAIVVLMGGPTTKIPEAADLYIGGYADLIIMAQTPHGSLEPDPETGILSAGETERSRLILLDLGVPKEDIIIIPSMTWSTRDEADAVCGYLEQRKEINSLILATSSAHTRRAYIIFTRALETLDRDIKLISRASRHGDTFQADGWWRDGPSRRLVILEYQKIIYYYLTEIVKW